MADCSVLPCRGGRACPLEETARGRHDRRGRSEIDGARAVGQLEDFARAGARCQSRDSAGRLDFHRRIVLKQPLGGGDLESARVGSRSRGSSLAIEPPHPVVHGAIRHAASRDCNLPCREMRHLARAADLVPRGER